MRAALALGLSLLPALPALAAPAVALDSAVFVEKSGDAGRVVQRAARLVPGDRVVTILTWRRSGPGSQFTLVNPLPHGLYYEGSAREDEQVSVDGGRNWGRLDDLRVNDRLATAEDVTHVRWRIASSQTTGRIAYSAIVR